MSTAPDSAVYALADPTEVDVAAIERELESLWRDAAKGEGTESVTRATAFNLIYVTATGDDEAASLLATLTLEHPSRSILLLLGSADAPSAQSAWVTAYCHRPNPSAPQICSEFISLECAGSATTYVASTLRSLMLGGLPTVIVWSAHIDIHHPLLMELGYDSNRVITAVVKPADRVSALNRIWNLHKLFGNHVVVSDVIWSALLPARSAIARALDNKNVKDITELHFSHWSAECAVIAAWIAAILNWTLVDSKHGHDHATLNFSGNKTMSFADKNSQQNSTSLAITFQNTEQVTIEIPHSEAELTKLIDSELNVWSCDPVFEQTFDTLQQWLTRR